MTSRCLNLTVQTATHSLTDKGFRQNTPEPPVLYVLPTGLHGVSIWHLFWRTNKGARFMHRLMQGNWFEISLGADGIVLHSAMADLNLAKPYSNRRNLKHSKPYINHGSCYN